MSSHHWDVPFGKDVEREVIQRRHDGSLHLLDSCSEDALVLATIRNHRPEMRFRLTYDGSLKSSGNKRRTEEKWDIRKFLEPQLAELWSVHPALKYREIPIVPRGEVPPGAPPNALRAVFQETDVLPVLVDHGSHRFLPLVRKSLFLTCTLDVLFLRKDRDSGAVDGGDLDNRLTTLFDGLCVPTANEMPAGGQLNADPFHCLLESDKLISNLTVRTDYLLTRPNASPDEVRLILDVIVSPTKIQIENNAAFLGD